MTNATSLALIAAALYLVSGVLIGVRLFYGRSESGWKRTLPLVIGLFGSLAHGVLLYQSIIVPEGLNLGFFNAFSLVAWTVALLLLLTSLINPVENLGIVTLPLAVLAIVLDLRFPNSGVLPQTASWGMKIHILVSLLAYSLLTLASIQAVLLAIQDQHLHNRQPGGFIRALPPLQTMENLLFEMIGVGFVLLTLSLLSGFAYLENMFAQHVAHKTILSIVAWFVFATLLWGRFRYGWRGRTALIWTLSGFVVLMLAYFGSKAVIELIL
ncbi:MAG TPA: cytochrome C biogenesis protein [Chromatiales bacterium]|nr:cytochrome C biogenesis protein [Chromatiales bacterium]